MELGQMKDHLHMMRVPKREIKIFIVDLANYQYNIKKKN